MIVNCFVTFPTTHMALQAESAARKAGISIRMMPVPRHISSDCNVGMRVSLEARDAVVECLSKANIDFAVTEER